ncbi:CLCN3 [Cordylochernes scorpioides]|uniref:CLCN3 n=1 Tax=Cordylochernes scorpioides TaxID=51811 RepID=A0ABY6KGI6_9ARAC|nr:CLCN3 [Cordylochernes scorpioides]
MDVCKNMIEMTRTDPEWMQKIITGDKTWVYQYDPEIKRQSSQWIERGEPKPKKASFTKSKVKTLLVTFFYINGLVHHEFILFGRTINQEDYLGTSRVTRATPRVYSKGPQNDVLVDLGFDLDILVIENQQGLSFRSDSGHDRFWEFEPRVHPTFPGRLVFWRQKMTVVLRVVDDFNYKVHTISANRPTQTIESNFFSVSKRLLIAASEKVWPR